MGVGLAVTLAGCSSGTASPNAGGPVDTVVPHTTTGSVVPLANKPLPPIPRPHPGASTKIDHVDPGTDRRICLTVDDGFNAEVVAGYVGFVQRTGIHLTFSPNGTYSHEWAPHAGALEPLLANGQVQIINHTFSHHDLTRMSDARITHELEKNDDWVQQHFGITTRPYYRPPYGYHNEHVDGLAASLGYTRTVMWNGSYSDSEIITPQFLMSQARKYLNPGVLMLCHANHPTVLGLFDQIMDLIRQRQLTPVTLDEMFGTSRATG